MSDSSSTTERKYRFRLYVAGQKTKSLTAIKNLRAMCEEHLAGRYSIEIIDLIEQPDLAEQDQIVALPTLVRSIPTPVKRIIGDLSKLDQLGLSISLDE